MQKKVEVNVFLNLFETGGNILDFYIKLSKKGLSFEGIVSEFDQLADADLLERVLFRVVNNDIYFSTIPRNKQETSLFTKIEEPCSSLLFLFSDYGENEEIHIETTIGALGCVFNIDTIPLLAEQKGNVYIQLRMYNEKLEKVSRFNPEIPRILSDIWKYSM